MDKEEQKNENSHNLETINKKKKKNSFKQVRNV